MCIRDRNTVAHRFSLTDATENMMLFEQVRIPLYRENGMDKMCIRDRCGVMYVFVKG